MIRLLLALLLATAHATPPPKASAARFEGFHRVYVTPDAFADGLAPADAPPVVEPPPPPPAPPPPPPRHAVMLVLEPQATTDAGHTADTLAEHLRTLEGVSEVEVDSSGASLLIELDAPQDLATVMVPVGEDAQVPLGSLGELATVPDLRPRLPSGGVPRPQAIPAPEPGHDLVLENVVGVRVVVKVAGVEVGELKPRATGVIHDVRPGTYEVGFVGPTGFERQREVATVPTRARPAE